MFKYYKEYLTDAVGKASSTRLQSVQTHLFALIFVLMSCLSYISLTIIYCIRYSQIILLEIPDNLMNIFLFTLVILLTYASAPKAFAQRAELKSYRNNNNQDSDKNETKE